MVRWIYTVIRLAKANSIEADIIPNGLDAMMKPESALLSKA